MSCSIPLCVALFRGRKNSEHFWWERKDGLMIELNLERMICGDVQQELLQSYLMRIEPFWLEKTLKIKSNSGRQSQGILESYKTVEKPWHQWTGRACVNMKEEMLWGNACRWARPGFGKPWRYTARGWETGELHPIAARVNKTWCWWSASTQALVGAHCEQNSGPALKCSLVVQIVWWHGRRSVV